MSEAGHIYQTQSAVLFIIFNRPDTTSLVFGQIKAARPSRLYIAADGPRTNRPDENVLCQQARHIATQIDWDCEVKTLFKDKNAGCKEAVSSAITWFFDNEEEGIILEDDCLPANSFFKFCDELLDKYRADERIRHISGGNFQHGKKWGDTSYYFSTLTHVWGWASWRRVWKDYDKELSGYSEVDAEKALTNLFNEPSIINKWLFIFKELKAGKIDTWDYQYAFLNFFKNGLSIIPNKNLISNIGFGSNATHTVSANAWANLPVTEIQEITHPTTIEAQKQADLGTLNDQTDGTIKNTDGFFEKTLKRWRRSINKRMGRK